MSVKLDNEMANAVAAVTAAKASILNTATVLGVTGTMPAPITSVNHATRAVTLTDPIGAVAFTSYATTDAVVINGTMASITELTMTARAAATAQGTFSMAIPNAEPFTATYNGAGNALTYSLTIKDANLEALVLVAGTSLVAANVLTVDITGNPLTEAGITAMLTVMTALATAGVRVNVDISGSTLGQPTAAALVEAAKLAWLTSPASSLTFDARTITVAGTTSGAFDGEYATTAGIFLCFANAAYIQWDPATSRFVVYDEGDNGQYKCVDLFSTTGWETMAGVSVAGMSTTLLPLEPP
jgi:hypothetical protein